jgi:hypothetical protein
MSPAQMQWREAEEQRELKDWLAEQRRAQQPKNGEAALNVGERLGVVKGAKP